MKKQAVHFLLSNMRTIGLIPRCLDIIMRKVISINDIQENFLKPLLHQTSFQNIRPRPETDYDLA